MRTEKECKKLGIMMAHGEIFHSGQVRNPNDVPLVFMVLALADKETLDKMLEEKIVALYEHMSQRQYRSINGMPTFFSANMLDAEENKIVIASYNEEVLRMRELEDDSNGRSNGVVTEPVGAGGSTGDSAGTLPDSKTVSEKSRARGKRSGEKTSNATRKNPRDGRPSRRREKQA